MLNCAPGIKKYKKTLKDNCGMCRVQHLLQQGRKYDIPEDDLRIAGGSLGVVGVTESGDRYIALPSHAQQLEHWAKDCATVVDYHRNNEELDQVGNPIPFDDDLPNM